MTDKNQERDDVTLQGSDGFRGSENDALDRELDAALSRYAAVEPRSGLEERILANLQYERAQVPERVWWRWGVAVTLAAAVVIVAVALMWKSGRPAPQQIVEHPVLEQSPKKSPPQVLASNQHGGRNVNTPARRTVHPQVARDATATPGPKLDVFPSPQPLSDQEKLLARYAQREPDRAAVLAEARMDCLKRDAEERRQIVAEDRDSRE